MFNVFPRGPEYFEVCPKVWGWLRGEEECFTYVYQCEGEGLGRGISQFIEGRNHHGVIGVKIQLVLSPRAIPLAGKFFWEAKGIGPIGEPSAEGKVWFYFCGGGKVNPEGWGQGKSKSGGLGTE